MSFSEYFNSRTYSKSPYTLWKLEHTDVNPHYKIDVFRSSSYEVTPEVVQKIRFGERVRQATGSARPIYLPGHKDMVCRLLRGNFVLGGKTIIINPDSFPMSAVKYLEDSYNKEEAAHFPILVLPLSNRISSSERLPDIFFTSPFQAVTGKEEQMKESLTLDWLQ
ncbi:hypothetical protein CDAR_197971 [Caerostris darwini]|uniref:Uncharacterized protein n=1 Tax=Caerostris darwini TaxID=1538125 RepID=A0AAV4SJT7_9ARAC|nr:hypothetical protein CDAR_197971 [Caerostris darwini]